MLSSEGRNSHHRHELWISPSFLTTLHVFKQEYERIIWLRIPTGGLSLRIMKTAQQICSNLALISETTGVNTGIYIHLRGINLPSFSGMAKVCACLNLAPTEQKLLKLPQELLLLLTVDAELFQNCPCTSVHPSIELSQPC